MTVNQAKLVNANANTTEEVSTFVWNLPVANDEVFAIAA